MKKIICIVLVLLLCLSVMCCTNTQTQDEGDVSKVKEELLQSQQQIQSSLDEANQTISQITSQFEQQKTAYDKLESELMQARQAVLVLQQENQALKDSLAEKEQLLSEAENENTIETQNKPSQTVRSEQHHSEHDSATVYITNTGSKYHCNGCQYLKKSQHAISLVDAKSQGYEPCSRCSPPS